jgi:hypothetical protein
MKKFNLLLTVFNPNDGEVIYSESSSCEALNAKDAEVLGYEELDANITNMDEFDPTIHETHVHVEEMK